MHLPFSGRVQRGNFPGACPEPARLRRDRRGKGIGGLSWTYSLSGSRLPVLLAAGPVHMGAGRALLPLSLWERVGVRVISPLKLPLMVSLPALSLPKGSNPSPALAPGLFAVRARAAEAAHREEEVALRIQPDGK